MAYSVDYRQRVLEYLEEGHTQAKAQEVFRVGATTIKAWKRLVSNGETLEKKTPLQKPRTYPSDKLRAYIKERHQSARIPTDTPIVDVDECGIEQHMSSSKARSPRGERVRL